MNPNLEGKWYRSDSQAYSLSNTLPIKLDFLAGARYMAAPEVADIIVRFNGTVGAVTGGALGRDAAKTIEKVSFRDEDEVINASGAALRVLEQMEFGDKQVDPADITSGSTNTTYSYRLRITAEPLKAHRPRDTRIPLAHFLEGGELLIQTPAAVPTGWAAVQADQRIRVFVRVVDGRVPEVKSRFRIKEEAISQQEFDYQINGSLRAALITSKLATTGYTTLAAYTTLFSRTLETPPDLETDMFVDYYRRYSDSLGTNDEFTLAAPGAIPLMVPRRWQKIGEMIDTKTLHIDLRTTAPASGRLLTWSVVDRTPNLAAMVAGYSSVPEYQRAIVDRGVVVDGKGGESTKGFLPALSRRLPMRFK